MTEENGNDEWHQWWDARVAAIETILGRVDDTVGHALVPFDLGTDIGGAADVIYFKNVIPGVVAVTSELIGRDDQVPNAIGNYELAICHRADEPWGANLISRLAYYTLEAKLNPGETMDLGSATADGSSILRATFFRLRTL